MPIVTIALDGQPTLGTNDDQIDLVADGGVLRDNRVAPVDDNDVQSV
jgi:hypothetical protein